MKASEIVKRINELLEAQEDLYPLFLEDITDSEDSTITQSEKEKIEEECRKNREKGDEYNEEIEMLMVEYEQKTGKSLRYSEATNRFREAY